MSQNLILDVKLNQDSYLNNNTNGGSVAGLTRVAVTEYRLPPGSNFAAQLYQNSDGTYKIAYRGTANPGAPGDLATNGGIALGLWTAEMGESVRFTFEAIRQVAARDNISFDLARAKFNLTGHSQGGFEAELNAKFFGTGGTSIDGPGAAPQVGTGGWNALKNSLRAQEPSLQQSYDIGDFLARRYTVLVGGANQHIAGGGMVVNNASASLFVQGILFTTPFGAAASLGTQVLYLHKLENILKLEELRQQVPWLQKLVDANDPNSNPAQIASDIASEWAQVQVGTGTQVSANDVQATVNTFLGDRAGQTIAVQELNKTVRIQSSNGDTLLLFADGSGVKLVGQGIAVVQTEYIKGGSVLATSSTQLDDSGNTLVTRTGSGFATTYALDTGGQVTNANHQIYDNAGQFQSETVFIRNANGTTTALAYNSANQLQSTTTSQTYDDGTSLTTTRYTSGAQSTLSTDTRGGTKQIDLPDPSNPQIQTTTTRNALGAITTTSSVQAQFDVDANNMPVVVPNAYLVVNKDSAGVVTSTGERIINPVDGSSTDVLTPVNASGAATGPTTVTSTGTGAPVATGVLNTAAQDNLASAASGLLSGINLINTVLAPSTPIKPLPVGAGVIRLAKDISPGTLPLQLTGVASVATAVSNVLPFFNIANDPLFGALRVRRVVNSEKVGDWRQSHHHSQKRSCLRNIYNAHTGKRCAKLLDGYVNEALFCFRNQIKSSKSAVLAPKYGKRTIRMISGKGSMRSDFAKGAMQ